MTQPSFARLSLAPPHVAKLRGLLSLEAILAHIWRMVRTSVTRTLGFAQPSGAWQGNNCLKSLLQVRASAIDVREHIGLLSWWTAQRISGACSSAKYGFASRLPPSIELVGLSAGGSQGRRARRWHPRCTVPAAASGHTMSVDIDAERSLRC